MRPRPVLRSLTATLEGLTRRAGALLRAGVVFLPHERKQPLQKGAGRDRSGDADTIERPCGLQRIVRSGVMALLVAAIWAPAGIAQTTYTVCSKQGSELDLNSSSTSGMRAKLSNGNYFGPGGTVAPEQMSFQSLFSLNSTSLAACDIFIGGGGPENLSITETQAIRTWVNSGNRFVIAGCDSSSQLLCGPNGLQRGLTNVGSGSGISLNFSMAYNPLTCGGVAGVNTFGGAATLISPLGTDTVLATHNGGFSGQPAAIAPNPVSPNFLMTADPDMYGSAGNGVIGTSAIASSDQAVFVLNSFKFAADALSGRLLNPQCPVDYNSTGDLEIGLTASATTTRVGNSVDFEVEVANTGGTSVGDITALFQVPASFSFVSHAGPGSYNDASGAWNIGTLDPGDSVTLVVTSTAAAVGSPVAQAEIAAANLPDSDSAPNASFGEDDLADGLNDDDEASLALLVEAEVGNLPPAGVADQCPMPSLYVANGASGTWPIRPDVTVSATTSMGGLITDQARTFSNIGAELREGIEVERWQRNGGDINLTIDFSPAIPASEIALVVYDLGLGLSTPYNATFDFAVSGGATTQDFRVSAVDGETELLYRPSTGRLDKSDPSHNVRESAVLVGQSASLVSQITLTSSGVAPADFLGVGLFAVNACDFSDAPAGLGAPAHSLIPDLYLGTQIDDENDALPTTGADGDDTENLADEDGVTFPTLVQGQSAAISVEVTQASANDGYLQGWIDWNGDGDFADAGEQVATDLQSPGAGASTISVPVTVTATATTSPTFARFRWSTTPGLDATTAAPDGEVEDYGVTITAVSVSTDTSTASLCLNQSGTLLGPNLFTAADGGTFGTGSGAADEIAATNPYPGVFGTYTYHSNLGFGGGTQPKVQVASNYVTRFFSGAGHAGVIDPENGATGRFILVDGSPAQASFFTETLSGLSPNTNYEFSMWVSNMLDADNTDKVDPDIGMTVDGVTGYASGPIAETSEVVWKRVGFVFNTGSRTSATLAVRDEGGSADGNDFMVDNITVRSCDLPSGTVTGIVYLDAIPQNDALDPAEAKLDAIRVQLIDDQGDASAANDIIVAEADTATDGTYSFTDVPLSANYIVRVDAGDADLPGSVTGLGTPNDLAVNLATDGQTISGQNFGFDDPTASPYTPTLPTQQCQIAVSSWDLTVPAKVVDGNYNGLLDAGWAFTAEGIPVRPSSDAPNAVATLTEGGEVSDRTSAAGTGPAETHMMVQRIEAVPGVNYTVDFTQPVRNEQEWYYTAVLDADGNVLATQSPAGSASIADTGPGDLTVTVPAAGSAPGVIYAYGWVADYNGVFSSPQANACATVSGVVYDNNSGDDTFNAGTDTEYETVDVTITRSGGDGTFGDGNEAVFATVQTAASGGYTLEVPLDDPDIRIEADAATGTIPAGATITTPNPVDRLAISLAGPNTADFGVSQGDLSLSLSMAPTDPADGDVVTFTHLVSNEGVSQITGISVAAPLPAAVSFDSAAGGGTYDDAAGVWTVGDLAVGGTARLDLVTIVSGTVPVTFIAEISAADQGDVDSIPGTGATNGITADDGRDGDPNAVDDDEASVTFTPLPADIELTGTVFFDDGSGTGATAHDGAQAGSEPGAGGVTLEAVDAGGAVVATALTDGTGAYALAIPAALDGSAVTIHATAPSGVLHIAGAVSGATDSDTTDGKVALTLAAGTSYGFDFGLARAPRLTEDQVKTVASGGSVMVAHTFTAGAPVDAVFALAGESQAPAGSFATALFHDEDCSGTLDPADLAVAGPRSLVAGEQHCLLVRVSAVAGAANGAAVDFDLTATGTYALTATPFGLDTTNRVTVSGKGALMLEKSVCNATSSTCDLATGAGFGRNNAGRPGDTLVYRIVFSAPGPDPVDQVEVFDRTPAYSALTATVPAVVLQPAGVSCGLVKPAAPAADYTGDIEWSCPGTMNAGEQGVVSFEVQVAR